MDKEKGDQAMIPIILYDDREILDPRLSARAGKKRFGQIWLNGATRYEHFEALVQESQYSELVRIEKDEDAVLAFESALEKQRPVLLISAKAGINDRLRFLELLERLALGDIHLKDAQTQPLLIYVPFEGLAKKRIGDLDSFQQFSASTQFGVIGTDKPYQDISVLADFLSYINLSTKPREFNQIELKKDQVLKSSGNIEKIEAEFDFYQLAPKIMQSWFVQPFDLIKEHGKASYKTKRYLLSDCGFQWVNEAWSLADLQAFLDTFQCFIDQRVSKETSSIASLKIADELFYNKVISRWQHLEESEKGASILAFVSASANGADLISTKDRYLELYTKHRQKFVVDKLVVGHGDPCFSNILYDVATQVFLLIDPKGASNTDELFTHPIYDLCKISHSLLGDYDLINNGKYRISVNAGNSLHLEIQSNEMKNTDKVKRAFFGEEYNTVRLGEVSLFLSMLPLHLDDTRKVTAFLLNAKEILDKVEAELT